MNNGAKREYEAPRVTLIEIDNKDILSASPVDKIGFIGDLDGLDVNSSDHTVSV